MLVWLHNLSIFERIVSKNLNNILGPTLARLDQKKQQTQQDNPKSIKAMEDGLRTSLRVSLRPRCRRARGPKTQNRPGYKDLRIVDVLRKCLRQLRFDSESILVRVVAVILATARHLSYEAHNILPVERHGEDDRPEQGTNDKGLAFCRLLFG